MSDIPKTVRMLVYNRDHQKCRWCGRANVGLDVHHINYRSAGGSHDPSNLILLCRFDHDMVHRNKNIYPSLLQELLERPGLTGFQLVRRKARADMDACAFLPCSVDRRSSEGSTGT